MLSAIDNFLDRITMYRLVLYVLTVLVAGALVFSFFGWLPFSPIALGFSALTLVAVCWSVNTLFAWVWEVPANVESAYITALILALIVAPPSRGNLASGLALLFWVAVWSMAAKYLFAWRGKHMFNPAALAVALTALTVNQSASWWVGTRIMLPLALLGGLLLVRKLRRFQTVSLFLFSALAVIVMTSRLSAPVAVWRSFLDSPLIFFSAIMFTEPATCPTRRWSRAFYGLMVGLLFAPAVHIGSLYSTPELALLAGNIFAFAANSSTPPA